MPAEDSLDAPHRSLAIQHHLDDEGASGEAEEDMLAPSRSVPKGHHEGRERGYAYAGGRESSEKVQVSFYQSDRCFRESQVAGDEIRSDWTIIKARIRERIPEIAFLNWLASTREVERWALSGTATTRAAAAYIVSGCVVHSAALDEGITEVRLVTQDAANVAHAHTDHGCLTRATAIGGAQTTNI
jgi:hypothetical protein